MGDTGDARRGWVGIPRADAKLLAIEDVSLFGKRGFPISFGGCWLSVFDAPGSVVFWEVSPVAADVGFSCWKRRI